ALFLLVMLSGAFQILFGIMRLGRILRFVSYSVMNGFLAGVAVLLIMGQRPTITGISIDEGHRVERTSPVRANLQQGHLTSLGVAALTLALGMGLPYTRLDKLGGLIAIIVPSVAAAYLFPGAVQTVGEVGQFPGGPPSLFLPSLSTITTDLITGALALTAVLLVQGAGVSQGVENPDGSPRHASRDFIAQGVANLSSGALRGLRVGVSSSATALSVMSGARRRWAAILSGVLMAVFVLAFPGLIASVATPALGAILILAGVR